MALIQRPNSVGLLLCRMMIIEERSHNVTLVNTFQRLKFAEFASRPIPFVAYTVLTDGLGEVTLDLAASRCDTLEQIYTRSLTTTFRDPLRQERIYWHIRSCSFPAPGRYQFALLADDDIITQSTLEIAEGESDG